MGYHAMFDEIQLKEQIKDTILRIRSVFTILIRNQKTECCIESIEWKSNVNGERIENAEYLKMGDTAQVTLDIKSPIFISSFDANFYQCCIHCL